MKRLRTILLFLLLGAMMNVAVAWAITLIITPKYPPMVQMMMNADEGGSVIDNIFMAARRRTRFGSHFYSSLRVKYGSSRFEDFRLRLESLPFSDDMPKWGVLDEFSRKIKLRSPLIIGERSRFEGRGWPRLSLWCIPEIILTTINKNESYGSRGLIVTPLPHYQHTWTRYTWTRNTWKRNTSPRNTSPRYLPLYPIWSGFLVNTIFYAVILWLLIPGPFVLRRFTRRKRGLCENCAYDLRGAEHDACPECGTKCNPLPLTKKVEP